MSIEVVKEYFRPFHMEDRIIELEQSSATVDLAAKALNTEPARIAKTLSFYAKDGGCNLIVTAGDGKVDNKKYKALFSIKAKMLTPEDVESIVGFSIGGVCPFGIKNPKVSIYLDESLKRFQTVFPACGSSNSAIELTLDELMTYSKAIGYIDVCKGWQKEITFKISKDLNSLPEAKTIRETVFMKEQGFQNEFDDIDPSAYHIVAYEEDKPIGTARLFPTEQDKSIFSIGRVAVLPEDRGKRIGQKMMKELEAYAKERGALAIELSAQTRVMPFYQSLGYTPYGEEYFDEFCPHKMMRKELKFS